MLHSLRNELLEIKIDSVGAELASLQHLETGKEYMWQADPNVWGSHAPVLFPIVGALKSGYTEYEGRRYEIPKHGLVRNNENLELYKREEDRITFRLCWSEETLKKYPFKFDFRITYRLRNEHVIVYYEVYNPTSEPIYFSLGGHPAFRVPFFDDDQYDDYFLRFEHPEDSGSYRVLKDGTLSTDTVPVPWTEGGRVLPLTHELFANDALVFTDLETKSINLESRKNGPVLKVDFAGWTELGIWAKPNGDFVCIEPWLGLADRHDTDQQLVTKEGILELAGMETYEMSFDVKVL